MATKTSSAVWEIGVYEKRAGEALCILCTNASEGGKEKILKTSGSSTKSLVTHLNLHPEHRKLYEDLCKSKEEAAKEEVDASQPKINSIYRPAPAAGVSSLDRKVLHFIASTNQPFLVVNCPTFKALLSESANDELKDEKHYREWVLPRIYEAVKLRVKAELDKCSAISFTTDMWSGSVGSLMSLTAHGITHDWRRVKFVLCIRLFQGEHNGENIGKYIREMLHEWKITEPKCHVFLHDQGSNVVKAFQFGASSSLEDADCGAHKLHLVVSNSLYPVKKHHKNPKPKPPVQLLMEQCRSIVGHFHRSSLARERLAECQVAEGLEEHAILQDVETRWTSSFTMLERLLEQRRALDKYALLHQRSLLLSTDQWAVIEELVGLLQPFTDVSERLCREESPLSFQLAARRAMLDHLESFAVRSDDVKPVIESMKAIIHDKFDGLDQFRSHYLDPRFFCGLSQKYAKKTQRTSQELEQTRLLDEELRRYAAMDGVDDWDIDPLHFWKENESSMPRLAEYVRRYLSAPATSHASEQLFSEAALCFDPLRANLSASKAEKLIFLNKTLPVINYRY